MNFGGSFFFLFLPLFLFFFSNLRLFLNYKARFGGRARARFFFSNEKIWRKRRKLKKKYMRLYRREGPPFWIMIVTCRGSGMWGKNVKTFFFSYIYIYALTHSHTHTHTHTHIYIFYLSFYKRNKMGRRVPSRRDGGVSSFLDRSINCWCWGPRNLGATSTLGSTLFWVGSNGFFFLPLLFPLFRFSSFLSGFSIYSTFFSFFINPRPSLPLSGTNKRSNAETALAE